MTFNNGMPPVYPVSSEDPPARRRAVFSSAYVQLDSQHAQPPGGAPMSARRRSKHYDDSLRLIDDLVNRPVDVLYSDSRLTTKPDSKVAYWGTRIVVLIICIAVGFAGCLFVRLLNIDPRKQVRQQLASQLEAENKQIDDLEKQISDLRTQVEKQSKSALPSQVEQEVQQNDMVAGSTAVEGEGIILTIADPMVTNSDAQDGSLPREKSTNRLRAVTDTDLQLLVSLMWQSGAEAVSINDNRLGVQTSIRTAGNSILVGTTPVSSPYKIQAIGNKRELADKMGQKALPTLYKEFKDAGMTLQISKENSIQLKAASVGQVSYAKEM